MRRALLQFFKNRISNILPIASQMRIPEPKCLDTPRLKESFALRITSLLIRETMLTSVEFDI